MKHLGKIQPSAEQLKIVSTNQLGVEIIRGAAGSGKTTTALLRLKSLASMLRFRKERMGDSSQLKILLLTFNRTLAGYVRALAEAQAMGEGQTVEIQTFAKWALMNLNGADVHADCSEAMLWRLISGFNGLERNYLHQEVEYLLGRFDDGRLEDYVTTERTGRGVLPRVDAVMRRRILDDVVYPYLSGLKKHGWNDWNTLAINMRKNVPCIGYDIVVVDESQDFSANQIRAINHHMAPDYAMTFVIDTAQRIYARGFTWVEAGVIVQSNRSHRLNENHRNTKEIAAFVSGILSGIALDDDGVMPNLDEAISMGPVPQVICGKYSDQVDWAINYIKNNVDLETESVAFLKPQGGRWFDWLKTKLAQAGVAYVDMQRNADWPEWDVNVALSTFHSAKGLEFDHVIILGFNQENTAFGEEERSDQVRVLRKLLAVAVARARRHVLIGYKEGEESRLTDFFKDGTYSRVVL